MRYERLAGLKDEQFRPLTCVKRNTFEGMRDILVDAERVQKVLGGRKNVLSMADPLLMCLEYLREYRTYFHVSKSYGVSESTCYRTIKWVEETLIKHPEFALPGRKALLKSDMEYEIVVIDATETLMVELISPKRRQRKTN